MRSKRPLCLVIALCMNFTLIEDLHAFGKNAPSHLMATIGDSITAGTFADTSTNLPVSIWDSFLGAFAWDNYKTLFLVQNKKSYSWASGEWIDSHYNRLDRYLAEHGDHETLKVLNVAVPGSVAANTLHQAQLVVDALKSGLYQDLKYVTFLIGSNDSCISNSESGTPNELFRSQLLATFAKLAEIQQTDAIPILVSSIPRVPLLGRPDIRNHHTNGLFTCDYFRNEVLGFCKSLTRWESDDELRAKLQIIDEKNAVLKEVISEVNSKYPQLKLSYSQSFDQYDPGVADLAMDCFHPNKNGQSKLSELLWRDQPWFK